MEVSRRYRQDILDVRQGEAASIKHPDLSYRLAAMDEESEIVLLRMDFGDTGNYGTGNSLIVWEAFKIHGGVIHAVEAFMEVMPAGSNSGWDE